MTKNDAEQLELALEIALRAHRGQKDKAGAPYILHPLRVMLRLEDDTERVVALLHDVVEDGGVSFGDLAEQGFPESVTGPLRRVTKLVMPDGSEEEYGAFIARLQDDPVARRVKMADLLDNMDMSRIKEPTERDRKRLEKYRRAYRQLEEAGRGQAGGAEARAADPARPR